MSRRLDTEIERRCDVHVDQSGRRFPHAGNGGIWELQHGGNHRGCSVCGKQRDHDVQRGAVHGQGRVCVERDDAESESRFPLQCRNRR